MLPLSPTAGRLITMEVEFAMKVEVKEEGLELSGQGSMKMTGTYSLSGSSYTLTPIEAEGTGTWSRKGNSLTLTSNDGTTIVFKKKLSLISSLSRRSMNCTTA